MKRVAILFFTMFVLLSACSRDLESGSPNKPSAPSSTLSSAKKRIQDIDFSKYPGAMATGAFGYNFGLTRQQIEASGVSLENTAEENGISVYKTTEAPTPWGGAEFYVLLFYGDRLLKLKAIGKDITSDATGSSGKQQYSELKDSLVEKYGNPKQSIHKVGLKLWNERDEFYQCLKYDGCGYWVDLWGVDGKSFMLQLHGLKRGEGYISITYEAQPELDEALAALKNTQSQITKKGL